MRDILVTPFGESSYVSAGGEISDIDLVVASEPATSPCQVFKAIVCSSRPVIVSSRGG